MSFTLESKTGPSIVSPTGASVAGAAGPDRSALDRAASAKQRAIDILEGRSQQAEALPVKNANRISPEEVSAVMTKTQISSEELGHMDTNETLAEQAVSEATKPKEEPLSTQYAILARKEKALRAKAQAQELALKAREDAFKAKEEAIKAKESEYQSKFVDRDRLKNDPFSVLAELGLTYDQLTNLALNAPKPEDIERKSEMDSLRSELKAIREAQEKTKQSIEQREKNSYDQALNNIRNEVKTLIKLDPTFETIAQTNSHEDVVDLIKRTFEQDGVLMTAEEAAAQVEEYLVEEAIKLAKMKKIQSRLAPKPSASAPVAKQASPNTMKTLTNSVGSSKPLSNYERAIKAFKGEL